MLTSRKSFVDGYEVGAAIDAEFVMRFNGKTTSWAETETEGHALIAIPTE